MNAQIHHCIRLDGIDWQEWNGVSRAEFGDILIWKFSGETYEISVRSEGVYNDTWRDLEPIAAQAFDLLELDGTDLRREPVEVRKATLASILRRSPPGVRLNEHLGAAR